jgi:hypothetical protein
MRYEKRAIQKNALASSVEIPKWDLEETKLIKEVEEEEDEDDVRFL